MKRITLLVALPALAAAAPAQVAAYSNVTTYSGTYQLNGGATTVGGQTLLIADDVNLAAGSAGLAVTSVTFSAANLNATAATFRPVLYFFSGNGNGGGPGTLLATLVVGPITLPGASANLFTLPSTSPTGFFAAPSGRLWAGVSFDGSASGLTTTQLNNLGQLLYSPPVLGASADAAFRSSAAGTFGSNPAGNLFNYGGNPTANFAWAFSVVPEPSSLAALGLGALALLRRRKARA